MREVNLSVGQKVLGARQRTLGHYWYLSEFQWSHPLGVVVHFVAPGWSE